MVDVIGVMGLNFFFFPLFVIFGIVDTRSGNS